MKPRGDDPSGARSAGISAETARDVRERVGKGDSPLPVPDSSGDSRPRSGANGQRKDPWQTDLAMMLNSLKRDPAVKYSSEGRALVRWLEVRLVCKDDTDLMMRTPAHQATKVATMARVFAARWDEIAAQLEQQGLSEENPGQDGAGAGPAGYPGDTTGT
ncbi:hypothetical protein [Streptomyces sp. NPDC002889]|uniref:hypothetical protein n=1 Tax=Streptomyces sp. NPDC002889 TaxID=3364669 RepID=UPI00369F0882